MLATITSLRMLIFEASKPKNFVRNSIYSMVLESELNSNSRVDEERIIIVSVIDEVIAYLHLTTDAEILCHVIPDLWLCHEYELTVAVSLFATPEIYEARECQSIIGECGAPYASQLA